MEARGAGAAGPGPLARSVSAAAGPGAGAARARREEKGRGGKRRRRGAGRLLPEQRVPRARRSSPPSHCPRRGCRGRRAELGGLSRCRACAPLRAAAAAALPLRGPGPRGWPGRRWGMLGRSGGGASAARGTAAAGAPGRRGRRRSWCRWCRGRGEGKLREPVGGPVRLGPARPAVWARPPGGRWDRPGRPSGAGVWLASRAGGRGGGGLQPPSWGPLGPAAPVAYTRVVSAGCAPGRRDSGGAGSPPGLGARGRSVACEGGMDRCHAAVVFP